MREYKVVGLHKIDIPARNKVRYIYNIKRGENESILEVRLNVSQELIDSMDANELSEFVWLMAREEAKREFERRYDANEN